MFLRFFQGNKWIGTWGGGLAKFDGVSWTNVEMNSYGVYGDGWTYATLKVIGYES